MHILMFLVSVFAGIYLLVKNQITEGLIVLAFSLLLLAFIILIYLIEKNKRKMKDKISGLNNELGLEKEYDKISKSVLKGQISELFFVKVQVSPNDDEIVKMIGHLFSQKLTFDTKVYFENGLFGVLFINLSEIIIREMKNQIESWLSVLKTEKGINFKYQVSYFEVKKDWSKDQLINLARGN